ncbi:tetratricopeptide repeat protein [Microbispora cellulosiformans]|uniref:Tetratricopeptide repeat protein n=1 Tax=Microbispora cellulosiformans TaxID=2614688 RepID=A0A5J5JWV7_9ACTN|nr:tetratricopeptide repeat protein [Microbispora cellulosiformans]KAA9374853.1 tetratricopeptide repeat protein [Microbispora cellulosiformans]
MIGLARLYAEAGFGKHESFAAAVNSHPLARESGVSVSRVSIGRYLSRTTVPDLAVGRVIVAVLAARLGRPLTLNDVWPVTFAPAVSDLALRYERSLPVTVECVAELLACEVDHARARALAALDFASPAVSEAITGWRYGLVDSVTGRQTESRDVTHRHVAQIRETCAWFSGLDHARGGGLVRSAVTTYLHDHVAPLLRGSYTDAVGCSLFAVAAEMLQLAGWMAYDLERHGLAQRYYIQALRLAKASGTESRGFDAFVLVRLSQQALNRDHADEALYLARAAHDDIALSTTTPAVRALAYAAEARACARLYEKGDTHAATACRQALLAAERELDAGDPGGEPAWIGYFDPPELAAELAHSLVVIGDTTAALPHLDAALTGKSTDRARDRLFCQLNLAAAHLKTGDLDAALAVAEQALPIAGTISSTRVRSRFRSFRRSLPAKEPRVVAFNERVHDELAGVA